MNRYDIIRMATEAGFYFQDAGYAPILHTTRNEYSEKCFERFAALVAAAERRKHQSDIERWKEAAVTAEKWRAMALSKDECSGGRTVQRIQQEAVEAERKDCAELADAELNPYPEGAPVSQYQSGIFCAAEHIAAAAP